MADKDAPAEDPASKATYDLSTQDLTYTVTVKSKEGRQERVLLDSVTATAYHGEVLAVVGPSGAGKSTFLDAVAGKIEPRSLSGTILVNKKPVPRGFRRLSAYVMQDDELFPRLTVQETLLFSARLRLSASLSSAELRGRVDRVIKELGLRECANTYIGDADRRGVSGGEKRRVSIGVDIIHDPPILFLDEPTSGLDSTAAVRVMQVLQHLAHGRQRTIVLTIHQPSFRLLELIDRALILAQGQSVFYGHIRDLVPYFEEFGRPVPSDANTLEFALDTIEEMQKSEEGLGPLVQFHTKRLAAEEKSLRVTSSLDELIQEPAYANNPLQETLILTHREFFNVVRDKQVIWVQFAFKIVEGLLLGSLFFDSGISEKGESNRNGLLLYAVATLIFTAFETVSRFIDSRRVLLRESSRGAYRCSSYMLSLCFINYPLHFFEALAFTIGCYFLTGLVRSVSAFFMFVLISWLAILSAEAFTLFSAIVGKNYLTAQAIAGPAFPFMFLFSGFFLFRQYIPKFWLWLHYLSLFKYPLESLAWNEFHRRGDVCFRPLPAGGCGTAAGRTSARTGDDILNEQGIGGVRQWQNVLCILAMMAGYQGIGYIVLVRQVSARRK